MTTWTQDEASVQDSDPRELITIEINPPTGLVWHHTSGTEDIEVAGVTYRAIAIDRDETKTPMLEEDAETSIILPIDHDYARRYPRQGVPPFKTRVTIGRYQVRSGEVRQLWRGWVMSMGVEKSVARFLVPSWTVQTMKRPLPILGGSRACQHILYSNAGCFVSTGGSTPDGVPFLCTTTVLFVAGRDVRVDLSNVPAANARRPDWARFGMIKHLSSGEPRSIAVHEDPNPGVSTVAELQMFERIVEMKVGDTVEVYAGCDHTVTGTHGCRPKFNNRSNYGGQPHLPSGNPFKLNNFGHYVQDADP